MSGIYGYIQADTGKKLEKPDIAKMQLWNQAYGRTGKSYAEGAGFYIGCFYEKISKYAESGSGCICKGNTYAVIDALLYNRESLLEKCKIKESVTDEELLWQYIELFGLDALKHVNGDFCGAIYNKDEHSFVMFRDHMGVRPLFYYVDDSYVFFSTDIRGLIALPEVNAEVKEEWIYKQVCGYVSTEIEGTEFEHIHCVLPSGYIRFEIKNNILVTNKKKYWKLGARKIRLSSEKEYQNRLRDLIVDSIKRRLDVVSGVVGAELSGGLDSSIIDVIINRLGREAIYFSWSANPDKQSLVEGDERLRIADICRQENIVCNYRLSDDLLDANSIMYESMRAIGYEPNYGEDEVYRFVFPTYINTISLSVTSQHINRRGAKVVFTGHGGDEGVSHRCNLFELYHHHEYKQFYNIMKETTKGQRLRGLRTVKRCLKYVYDTKKTVEEPFKNPAFAPELLRPEFAQRYREEDMPCQYFAYDPKRFIEGSGSRNRLDNIALQGAYSGARYMVPYLDYRVIDYAVSIPRYLYFRDGMNRWIFRETFKDYMPESLYQSEAKEANSRKSLKQNPDWFQYFAKKREDIVSRLDRDYWSKYLDFDVIDAWLAEGQPTEENRIYGERRLLCLLQLSVMQNLLDRVRGK